MKNTRHEIDLIFVTIGLILECYVGIFVNLYLHAGDILKN